jgi:GT2 family glycosyltransferase
VDNGSTDGTSEYLDHLCKTDLHCTWVHLSENTGFSRGNNFGVEKATGEILVLLNNDIVVTTGWLEKFYAHLQNSELGLVGPAVNFSGNETQVPIGYQDIREVDAFAKFFTQRYSQPPFDVRVVPFHCVAMRRDTWDRVGPLDSRFGLGMFEDDDYSLRVQRIGLRTVCADDIFIHHWGRRSFSKLLRSEHDQLFTENRHKFEDKWQIQWKRHRHRGWFRYLF